MKVIKKGRPQTGWAHEYVCTGEGNGNGGCGAELLVEQNDLFRTFSYAGDETTTYVTFRCCECRVITDIPLKDVPSQILPTLPKSAPRMAWVTTTDTK